jgi:hypothetical protein
MIAGLLVSNMILKRQFDAIDRSDLYWTYNKVLEKPFSYINITGGNETNIFYEQSDKPSVRLSQEWVSYHHGEITADVKNDTLFLNFDYVPANLYEKFNLQNTVPLRIFSPELLSVTGSNTNFEMQKLKQKSITVNISGRSRFEVENMDPEMDSINITQKDSSSVTFEMSPDYRKQPSSTQEEGKIEFHNANGIAVPYEDPKQNAFDENMSINSVRATVKDHSILDIGHAQIQNLDVHVSDSSAIILSGGALKLAKQ